MRILLRKYDECPTGRRGGGRGVVAAGYAAVAGGSRQKQELGLTLQKIEEVSPIIPPKKMASAHQSCSATLRQGRRLL